MRSTQSTIILTFKVAQIFSWKMFLLALDGPFVMKVSSLLVITCSGRRNDQEQLIIHSSVVTLRIVWALDCFTKKDEKEAIDRLFVLYYV